MEQQFRKHVSSVMSAFLSWSVRKKRAVPWTIVLSALEAIWRDFGLVHSRKIKAETILGLSSAERNTILDKWESRPEKDRLRLLESTQHHLHIIFYQLDETGKRILRDLKKKSKKLYDVSEDDDDSDDAHQEVCDGSRDNENETVSDNTSSSPSVNGSSSSVDGSSSEE